MLKQNEIQILLFVGIFMHFFFPQLLFFQLNTFNLLISIIFSQLIVDIFKYLSPWKYWIIEIFLRDLSGNFEIGKSFVEIDISSTIVMLELILRDFLFGIWLKTIKLLNSLFDSVLKKEIVNKDDHFTNIDFWDFEKILQVFVVSVSKLLVQYVGFLITFHQMCSWVH